ncbi:hypothetical protein K1T71_014736 [Dendrolimus kikuchii]|nr:hypothetical protein K1T71_014736 [Dendrolimus kikuchii]
MPTCAVNVCDKKSNTSNLEKDGVTFHIFPKDTVLKKKWTQSCKRKRNWEPTRTSTICSVHFDRSQFQSLANKRRKLIDNAVPTLFLSDTKSETLEESQLPGTSQYVPSIVKNDVNVESNIELTPRKKKMRKKIEFQAKKIKSFQSKTRYF